MHISFKWYNNHTMSKETLSQKLSKERDGLRDLMEATQRCIGGVARTAYQALNELPAAKYHPLDVPTSGFYSDNRFFKARRIVRAALLPDGPVALTDDGFAITETATETYRRQHYSQGKPVLKLPVQDRLVRVEISHPHQAVLYLPPQISISEKGYAEYDHRMDHTFPRRVEGDLADRYFGYASPEGLRRNYAESFTGALAVTSLVATCLHRAHGIESDVTDLGNLVDAWQQASPAAYPALITDMITLAPKGQIEA